MTRTGETMAGSLVLMLALGGVGWQGRTAAAGGGVPDAAIAAMAGSSQGLRQPRPHGASA